MAITYKLPKIDQDQVVILATPDGSTYTDTVMANGVLSIKDEAGNVALKIKASDLLSFKYDAYAAGTANIVDVTLTSATLVANGTYSLTVYAPNVQNFFGGGKESGAVYQARTYTVGVDATPTATELAVLFKDRINADVNAYFSATNSSGVLTITADSAGFGPLTITHTVPGTVTVADATAWVSPVGSADEVKGYVANDLLVTGSQYNRYEINYRKVIRHNAVTGLQVIKPVTALVYLDVAGSGTANVVTRLTGLLNGTYATTAAICSTYLGCPAV